jgi:hypothetical protein
MTQNYDSNKKAWYCQQCGRMEDTEDNWCPECDNKRQRVSRFEWFLSDALREFFTKSGRSFRIIEQWSISDHRGFDWYFDLLVNVQDKDGKGGISQIIEVNGPDHQRQKRYKGPGGGYTRDYDKKWELFSNLQYHKCGYFLTSVDNEECRMRVVRETAERLGTEILKKADSWH